MCDKINRKIRQKGIFVIFYTPDCSFCDGALKYLESNRLPFKGYNINKIDGGLSALIDCLKIYATDTLFDQSHKTKPVIFYKGKFIGGYSDLVSFKKSYHKLQN